MRVNSKYNFIAFFELQFTVCTVSLTYFILQSASRYHILNFLYLFEEWYFFGKSLLNKHEQYLFDKRLFDSYTTWKFSLKFNELLYEIFWHLLRIFKCLENSLKHYTSYVTLFCRNHSLKEKCFKTIVSFCLYHLIIEKDLYINLNYKVKTCPTATLT